MVIKCNNHRFWTGKMPIIPRNMQETGFMESRSHAYIWRCMHGGTCGWDIRFNPRAWKLIQLLTLQTRFDLVLINKLMEKHALCFWINWKSLMYSDNNWLCIFVYYINYLHIKASHIKCWLIPIIYICTCRSRYKMNIWRLT